MGVKEVLAALADKINGNPEGIGSLRGVFQFDLSGDDGGIYQVAFTEKAVSYGEGAADEPICTLTLSDANFLKLVSGDLNPTTAFMMGKLKVKGDLGLALKLHGVLQKYQ
ncbi:SCP2 sterol-binding domain-containing protein [Brevibacillus migulae]|uniref:SCP2 sterol-binding domain-containing protein n=1 Tax=Brevibacillus migulae TaxID=1644114 RepID=UPI00106E486A|nr:SCP2 sterol-binding domain-containing protein [Brevibacillus migulae]